MKTLLLLTILGNPVNWNFPTRVAVDLLETNHKHDKDGRHVFTQLILWERHPGNGIHHVRDWVILDNRGEFSGFPVRNESSGLYETWIVRDSVHYRITSGIHRESFTTHDPEVEDGKRFPKHLRNVLGTGKTEIPDE